MKLKLAGALALLVMAAPAQSQTSPATDGMTIARLQYDGGGDWYVGPSTLPNLLTEIRTRTGVPVAAQPVTVRATDPHLWRFPFLFMAGHGNIRFNDEELGVLRRYLTSGGFLLADDCYGMDESFRREMRRLFPDNELVEVPHDHPIYHSFYSFPDGLPKIHEHDGKPPQGFGIFHEGRLGVFWCSTRTSRTSTTAGRTRRCTTTRPSCGKRRSGWA